MSLSRFVIFLMCLFNVVLASSNNSFGFNFAHTLKGELKVERQKDSTVLVMLGDEIFLRSDDRYRSWSVVDARPRKGAAILIILGYDTGLNYCRYLYRVLDLSGAPKMSPSFGNCSEYNLDSLVDTPKFFEKSKAPLREWVLDDFVCKPKKRTNIYSYKHGQLFKGNRKIVAEEKEVGDYSDPDCFEYQRNIH